MAANLVDYRVEDGVAILALNDPPANTYTYEMNKALDACILAARMDDAVHVIVLRGAGEKFFSAGANIGMLSEVTPQFKYYFCLHANETRNRLEQAAKAVGRIKRAVQTGWEIPFESALALERELQQQLFQSEDAAEGIAAYNEKRKAQFTGK